jgi:hypothetical protein
VREGKKKRIMEARKREECEEGGGGRDTQHDAETWTKIFCLEV